MYPSLLTPCLVLSGLQVLKHSHIGIKATNMAEKTNGPKKYSIRLVIKYVRPNEKYNTTKSTYKTILQLDTLTDFASQNLLLLNEVYNLGKTNL
jgi:hypothetical protein